MSEASIVVRMQPPREVSPNFHGSWRARSQAVAELRRQAQWATRLTPQAQRFAGRTEPVVMDLHIAWCCGRHRLDADNAIASCKAIRDGIADELWRGEDKHVTVGTLEQVRGDGEVTVTLRAENRGRE